MKQICLTCKFWADEKGPRWGAVVDALEKRLKTGETMRSVMGPKAGDGPMATHCEEIKKGLGVATGDIWPQAGFTCNLWEVAAKTRINDIEDIE